MACHICRLIAATIAIAGLSCFTGSALAELQVRPAAITLRGPESSVQVVVMTPGESGRMIDVTRQVTFTTADPKIAQAAPGGLITPIAEGATMLVVQQGDERVETPIQVSGIASPAPVSFRNEIVPILTKAGCNSGGCHGKAEGQNGFKLSIFGFDTESDHQALTKESRGRRVFPASPERSLLFLKGSARVPHGGGRKIEPGGYRDQLLLRWIAEGAQFDAVEDDTRRIVKIEVDPPAQTLLAGESQQLRVVAIDAAGTRTCVTTEAEYESNAPSIAEVGRSGLVEASDIPGQAAILVRYLGHVTFARIVSPRPDVQFARPAEQNFIDQHVWNKLEHLGISPSDQASDAEFMRRVYLDTIGAPPTTEAARQFLADPSPNKRSQLIDQLLARDEYADYWTMHWLDILRADQLAITPQGAVGVQRWLHKAFTENRPFDQMARELLTVQGPTAAEGPGSFYKVLDKPDEASRAVSQLLLGVRIECAQCHHHPSERWSQADYVGLAGFFTGVKLKKLPRDPKQQAIVSRGGTNLPHPRTGDIVPARALGAAEADFSQVSDRRRVLADWMTSPDNEFFAKALANRLWAHYFGRRLIEPIDDNRATNPATNEPLMKALAEHLIAVNFDMKAFTRTLLNSRVYQLSSTVNASNESDRQNFSHAAYKTLPAEVLLDTISQNTGVPEKFNGWPVGYRAVQVWDNRMPSYFFTIFGRPARTSVCECERSSEPSIAQALHLLNAPEIGDKIGHRAGRARRLAAEDHSPAELIDEIYLGALARYPRDDEKTLMMQAFEGPDRAAAVEDIMWALFNSKEFIFNH